MPIQWTEAISVGKREIDAQHQHFIGLMNRIYQALEKLEGDQVIGNLLDELMTYAQAHFATEERYFDRYGYPGTEEHKNEHRKMFSQLSDFAGRFRTEGNPVTAILLDFIENWLVDHLENQDKKYSVWFKEKGIF